MKTTHTILFGLVAASAWLIAGSVTIPHTFQANTTAKAAEVNANFSAVKTAVDGNANDIATNTHDIAEAITDVNATGGLSGGGGSGDITIRRADGYISISPTTFVAGEDNGCYLKRHSTKVYFHTDTTKNDCVAYAPVFLPDGATIKSLTCRLYNHDGSTTVNPKVELIRRPYSISNPTGVILQVESAGDETTTQTISESNIDADKAIVDNKKHTYVLAYDPPDTTHNAGEKEKLYSCSIEYSFQ